MGYRVGYRVVRLIMALVIALALSMVAPARSEDGGRRDADVPTQVAADDR